MPGICTSTDIFVGRAIDVGADGISRGPVGRIAEFLVAMGDNCPAVCGDSEADIGLVWIRESCTALAAGLRRRAKRASRSVWGERGDGIEMVG